MDKPLLHKRIVFSADLIHGTFKNMCVKCAAVARGGGGGVMGTAGIDWCIIFATIILYPRTLIPGTNTSDFPTRYAVLYCLYIPYVKHFSPNILYSVYFWPNILYPKNPCQVRNLFADVLQYHGADDVTWKPSYITNVIFSCVNYQGGKETGEEWEGSNGSGNSTGRLDKRGWEVVSLR